MLPTSIASPLDPTTMAGHPTRLGAVSYLNTKPLICGLQAQLGPSGSLTLELPSRLADQLHSGRIDVGLIPVVESFDVPYYRIVSDAIIGCRGPVWSVRVFFRTDPSRVTRLALDAGSRTSVALAKVLFHARFGKIPETIPLGMNQDPRQVDAEAVLVIGDRAMHPERFAPHFHRDWDLGQAWLEETGLPFVFAMWVARSPTFATPWLERELERARDRGCDHVDEIAAQFADDYDLTTAQCADYLSNFLRFRMQAAERQGMAEFYARCKSLDLIDVAHRTESHSHTTDQDTHR